MKSTSICNFCNIIFNYDTSKSTGKFCSNPCSGKYRAEIITAPLIEQGLVDQAGTLKRYLTDKRGYKCEECGISEWNDKKLSLHVDHINGNSDDNLPSNLRLLCPNCHSQTETFSGRNKKNTKRNSYMQRYRLKKLVGNDRIELP